MILSHTSKLRVFILQINEEIQILTKEMKILPNVEVANVTSIMTVSMITDKVW